MPFPTEGLTFDLTPSQGGGAILVPEGEYLLEFKGVNVVSEDRDKFPMILVAEIIDGPGGKGRRISTFCHVFTDKGGFQLEQAYKSIGGDPTKLHGVKVPNYATYKKYGEALAKTFTGKRVGATITDNIYQGTRSSRVAEFYPADDFAERSKMNATVAESPNGEAAVVDEAMASDIDALAASL